MIVSILEREPESLLRFLPGMPLELEWIIKKALRKDRDRRYQQHAAQDQPADRSAAQEGFGVEGNGTFCRHGS